VSVGGSDGRGKVTGVDCPVLLPHHERIVLGHGSGGRLTGDLIRRLFLPVLGNATLLAGDDSAVLPAALLEGAPNLALSTDAHVVHPLFFPGGDIGRLAVCGTVNDLAMVGAVPLWMAAAFILEEGLPSRDLERIVRSMREAAEEAGIAVVAGDTKVAERGKVDGIYITTTGVGRIPEGREARGGNVRAGDAVLLSGSLGDHGIAVLAARGELAFRTDVVSDVAPLGRLVEAMYATGARIHALRDPTRGGLASALNELAGQSGVAVVLDEVRIPVGRGVEAACELLGFDPLHVANEGKLVAFVPEESADAVLAAMRRAPYGSGACRIGTVRDEPAGRVLMTTGIGGTRIVDMPSGELLPRIC
jgi:hydrogenase expression/formation protein HypE